MKMASRFLKRAIYTIIILTIMTACVSPRQVLIVFPVKYSDLTYYGKMSYLGSLHEANKYNLDNLTNSRYIKVVFLDSSSYTRIKTNKGDEHDINVSDRKPEEETLEDDDK